MLTSLLILNLNITVSTILKYCYKKALNKKLKLMKRTMKHFLKKLQSHEIFRSMVSRATKFLKPSSPPSDILNVCSNSAKFLGRC